VISPYTGGSSYLPDLKLGDAILFVAVTCLVGDLSSPVQAMLDTAAQWCILPPELSQALGCDLSPDPREARYSTRFGLLEGRLERLPITLLADEGSSLTLEATFYTCETWPGPPVLGWKGCLERIRLAIDPDPANPRFYFASL
jgi:hypothetical protein